MARRQGRRASHLRLLEHFTSYAVPSFTYSTFLFDSLLESLEYAYRRNELSFQTIRSTSVALWCGAFVYRPKVPIKCVLGDIGYMREDGEFVVLTNASDLVAKDSVKDSSVTLKSTSGEPVVQGSPDGSGIVRSVPAYFLVSIVCLTMFGIDTYLGRRSMHRYAVVKYWRSSA